MTKGSATTHGGGGRGPGGGRLYKPQNRVMPPPVRGSVRGAPPRGNNAPWYLKRFGSRPAAKLARALERKEAA